MHYNHGRDNRLTGPTQPIENPEFGIKLNFKDMIAEYSYVFKKVQSVVVADAKMLSILYNMNHYWPLNHYIGLTDVIYVASNPDDDCLFWEAIETQLGPDASNITLTQLDSAYTLFKSDLWDHCISPYINEETKAQCRYIAHFHNDGLWIATGE